MKRHLIAVVCAALLAVACPHSGSAQSTLQERQREARIACAEDRARFCDDVRPGRGRVIACMHLHADKLSQQCFQAMTTWGLAVANAFKACLPDAERLCPNLPLRGPRGRACMLMNADKLSKACHDALFDDEPFNGRRR